MQIQDESGFAFCAHVWLVGTDQGRENSQKLAAEQDRRELHERCRHCALPPPLTFFYSGDKESLKGWQFSHGADSEILFCGGN